MPKCIQVHANWFSSFYGNLHNKRNSWRQSLLTNWKSWAWELLGKEQKGKLAWYEIRRVLFLTMRYNIIPFAHWLLPLWSFWLRNRLEIRLNPAWCSRMVNVYVSLGIWYLRADTAVLQISELSASSDSHSPQNSLSKKGIYLTGNFKCGSNFRQTRNSSNVWVLSSYTL